MKLSLLAVAILTVSSAVAQSEYYSLDGSVVGQGQCGGAHGLAGGLRRWIY